MDRVKLFLCYAREDESLCKELVKHLRMPNVDVWYDRNISAGEEWKSEIDKHLKTSQIILLLISPDFINSDYCYHIEVKQAIERHKLSNLSEAYARAEQAQECWRSLGLAERVLEHPVQAQESSYRDFHAEYVNGQKGIAALILQDYDRAVSLFDKSLKSYPPTRIPGKASRISYQAEAYYGQRNVDYCADAAKEAFTLAAAVGAKNTLVRVKKLHAKLLQDGWVRERGTVELGMMIAEYERAQRQVIPGMHA